jgi:hypothetical protein
MPERTRPTAAQAQTNLHAVLQLVAAGRLRCSQTWRKRTLRCAELTCPAGSFTEQHMNLVGRQALLTAKACWWAINQLRREHAQGIRRRTR